MEQVEENPTSAGRTGAGTLAVEEWVLVDLLREAYRALCAIPCTSSKNRLPCPSGVDIPELFSIYNETLMHGDEKRSQMFHGWLDEKMRADQCVECGECLEKYPQHIEIPDWLARARKLITPAEPPKA